MNRPRTIVWLTATALLASVVSGPEVRAQDVRDFVVTGIRVEGLQRIAEGTVFNQLPVNIGDTLTPQRVREALRAVHASGFFRDVELRREEPGVLVIVVQELPSIRAFTIAGNKEVKSEDLTKSLRGIGLASGKILNRAVLEDARQYLIDQYFSRGRYAVRVDTTVDDAPGNLVDVKIDIVEGQRARIRQINITGNETFRDEDVLDGTELKTTNLLSFYRQDDRYSREAFKGDLEKIRSYYMDRGYANFEIASTQVAIAPEKDDLFITVNVFEGTTYRLGAIKLAGRFVVPEEELRLYLQVQEGAVFSQRLIAASEKALRERLAASGFGFAEVTAVPAMSEADEHISLTFQVEPNARTYVRRIDFMGVERTRDEVLRREMRQLEGAVLSNAAVERSEERLRRLPYLESVETETKPVAGTADLVDIEMRIEEGPSSQIGASVGYSERDSIMLAGNFIDSNLLGTGQRLAVDVSGGQYNKIFSVAHTEPYFTMNGVSRSLSMSYVDRKRLTSSFSQFSTLTYSAGAGLAYPLSENQFVNFGLSFSHEDLATVYSTSTQLRDWVRNNGDSYFRRIGSDPVLGTILDVAEINAGWAFDSRDRTLFPTRGGSYRFNFSVAPPFNGVSYAIANLRTQQFVRFDGVPLLEKIPLSLSADIGYGLALGDTTAVPPHRHIFNGGANTVRGFRDASLGPRDSLGNPFGGDAGIAAQLEAIVPLPEKFRTSARFSAFVDAGQSYFLGDTQFRNRRGDRTDYKFDLGEIRVSAGLAVQWLSPMGLFRFSYAIPLRYQEQSRREFGDELEAFQFSVGTAF